MATGLRTAVVPCFLVVVLLHTACSGPQSAMDPAGRGAERIASLYTSMAIGALAVWAAVVGLTFYAVRLRAEKGEARRTKILILGGGAVLPTVVVGGLLVHGILMLPDLLAPPREGSLRVEVRGEQWWWRVRYPGANGAVIELANEIRLPVGEPVVFDLESPDVIHSFWIPSLGGKMDMVPGRRNRLLLEPTRTGTFRGVCAEYCGASHALMAFSVVVMEKAEFAAWLQRESGPAVAPQPDTAAARGRGRFFANGCSACHRIRGTEADGVVGPDLTHVGSRKTLGAGTLPNDTASLVRWLARTDAVKPGVNMPHFGMLPETELQELAAYLESLK